MQSILLVSKNRKLFKEYIDKLCKNEKIDQLDVNVNSFEKALGIDDVRNLQKKIFLKPFRSTSKAVVIEAKCEMTIESQNALLKFLEEPPNNTIIIIVVEKIGQILPTILSRCRVIVLMEHLIVSQEEINQYFNTLISLLSSGIGDRLKIAQDFAKNKEEVITWIEKMIFAVREQLINLICQSSVKPRNPLKITYSTLDDNITQYLHILKSFHRTYKALKSTNVNPRLTLENLFLNLP